MKWSKAMEQAFHLYMAGVIDTIKKGWSPIHLMMEDDDLFRQTFEETLNELDADVRTRSIH